MGSTLTVGYFVFFLAPIILWVLVAARSNRGKQAKFLSLAAGHDGRLSLSRLQALAWTLIIFAAFCAAMAVHPAIVIAGDTEKKAAEKAYNDAVDAEKTARQAMDAAALDLVQKNNAKDTAAGEAKTKQKAADDTVEAAKKTAAAATGAAKKPADEAVTAAQKAADQVKADNAKKISDGDVAVQAAKKTADAAKNNVDSKNKAAETAKLKWRKTKWVFIPSELLALAGISLASGVFASVISASGNSHIDAIVTGIVIEQPAAIPPRAQPNEVQATRWLRIRGTGFGASGSVRLNNLAARVIYFADTEIGIDLPPRTDYKRLTIDSINGKVAYELLNPAVNVNAQAALGLGNRHIDYEWGDLFRDDESPEKLSLMKVQLFGFTAAALVIYAVIFLRGLSTEIDTLPAVDATVVMLTGLSQSGYLVGKGASVLMNK